VLTRRERPDDPRRLERDGFTVVRYPRTRFPLLRTWLDVRTQQAEIGRTSPRPDLLLAFQTFVSGFAGVRIQRRFGIPAVVWVRGEDEFRASGRTRVLSVPVWDEAAGVIVQSEAIRRHVLDAVRRHRPAAESRVAAKLEVVPNGIEVPRPVPPLHLPAMNGTPRVLAVGRLIFDKGMDLVVEAAAAAGTPLTIAGDGPERERIATRVRAAGADVRMEGAVPHDRLDRLYRESPIVVLASRRGEGLPNALLEAFAWGRAVVATSVGGVPDLVRDGENGLLVPPGDPAALRAAIIRLREEPGLAERLAAEGRRTAEAHAWERVRPKLEECLARWVRA
jgi:glycosyltransferase involved in cell wall biosynthesis